MEGRMMKKIPIILFVMALLGGCIKVSSSDPYEGQLHQLVVQLVYPSEYVAFMREDVPVTAENIASGVKYSARTDMHGTAMIKLPLGVYRLSVSDRSGESVFNGIVDKLVLDGHGYADVNLTYSKAGTLLIKEIYCGGCSKYPQEGNFQADAYFIIHNNDTQARYLDGLCFGTIAPYNSSSNAIGWNKDGILPDFAPVIQAIWRFGGSGTSFPLGGGDDAVISVYGAVDNTVMYPLSVNLNKPGYFACYNPTYFWNTMYHPAPGDNISPDHYLDVVIKMGQANAYTMSISSPAVVIFQPEAQLLEDFLQNPDNVIQVPGSNDRVLKLPMDWIIDGVEVFNGSSSTNKKRLVSAVDAGFITLSEIYKGHSVERNVDEAASAVQGIQVLQDTNNSTNDFHERETQSLHQ